MGGAIARLRHGHHSNDSRVRIIGTAKRKSGVLSFIVEGLNALDIGMFLDTQGIAVRTDHHCTEPVMDRFGIPGTVRASFMFTIRRRSRSIRRSAAQSDTLTPERLVMATIQELENAIVEDFALFDDWTEKYQYIIELEQQLPAMADALKTEDRKIKGCQSSVWLSASMRDGKVWFDADSDSTFVKGGDRFVVACAIRTSTGRCIEIRTQFH